MAYKKKRVKFKHEPPIGSNIPELVVTDFYVQGNMAEWLHSGYSDNVGLKKKLLFAKHIAQGMHALHSCNPPIIHHNLKSSNILVIKIYFFKH